MNRRRNVLLLPVAVAIAFAASCSTSHASATGPGPGRTFARASCVDFAVVYLSATDPRRHPMTRAAGIKEVLNASTLAEDAARSDPAAWQTFADDLAALSNGMSRGDDASIANALPRVKRSCDPLMAELSDG